MIKNHMSILLREKMIFYFLMNRIKELRKEKGLTQLELAKITNNTQTTVSGWEKGKIFPREDTLNFLADYFECSIDYLTGRADDFGNIQHPEQKEELTPSERELLEMYRGLSPEGKGTAKTLVKSVKEYEVAQQRKNGVKMG